MINQKKLSSKISLLALTALASLALVGCGEDYPHEDHDHMNDDMGEHMEEHNDDMNKGNY